MRRVGLLLAPWALCLASPARAQSAPTPARPRIGLALSGGAARGLAHIGVLRILEEAGVPVDVVAGTSMGAVVGGLYAVGYTAAQLDTIFTTQDWVALLTDPVRRRDLAVDRKLTEDQYLLTLPISRGAVHLPRSVVAGQRISQLLTGLTWSVHGVQDFRQLPIPFTAVATDLETGKAVVLDHGFLPDAIRASMAVPSVFSPVEIEDHVLIDGGVVRNLPAQDARALGADVLICSDVTDPLEPRDSLTSFADVLVQAVSFRIWDSEYEQRRHCDVLITPEVRAFSTFGFARAAELIARGEAAARAALPRIEAARAGASSPSPSGARAARPPVAAPESVLVATVRFDHPGHVPRGFLERVLGLRPPRWVSGRELDGAIDRLYATGVFESVRYRLGAGELIVLLRERPAGRFGLGLRYDSRYKASVLLSSTLGGIAGFGWSGQVDARLGQQIQVGVGASQPLGDGKTVALGAAADYARAPFDLYDPAVGGGHQVAQARVDLGALSASIARSLGTAVELSVRAKAEHARWDDEVSAVDSAPIERTFFTAAGVVEVDTYDRGVFPSRGVGLRAVSEWGNRLVGGGNAFSHHFADLRAYLPLYRTVSLWGGVTVGASGGDPPPHYQFFLGGANAYYLFPDRDIAFVGLHTQERRGRHVQKVEVGAQWEFAPDVFGRVRWNAGNTYERWTWDPAAYVDGVSVELGAKTFAGRLSLSLSANAHTTWPSLELDLGDPF
ncbi:MAG TPA: patatin-like phospholipase family protein [Gemmatimonadales bacterium]|nr:patatin-like phospholipase family protein [Gemmatimonadales bacterium]